MKILETVENLEKSLDLILETRIKLDIDLSELSLKLSKFDLEISDIMHNIEFNQVSDSQSIKLVKELKKLQNDRRLIKDHIAMTKSLIDMINSRDNMIKLLDSFNRKLTSKFKTNKSKTYNPRIRKDLFK